MNIRDVELANGDTALFSFNLLNSYSMVPTIQEIESTVIRKTNKYVYFNNGTHVTHSDFHKMKTEMRTKISVAIAKDIEGSQLAIVEFQREINIMQHQLDMLSAHRDSMLSELDWLKEMVHKTELDFGQWIHLANMLHKFEDIKFDNPHLN